MRRTYSIDFAERAVLGAILLDPDATIHRVVEKISNSRDVFTADNRAAYAAIIALHERGERIHPTTVYLEMQKMGSEPDGVVLMDFFGMPTADPGYVDQYIDAMIEIRRESEVKSSLSRIMESAADANIGIALSELAEQVSDKSKRAPLNLRTVLEITPPLQNYIFKGTIPAGGLIGVWSQGGLGKSFLMLQLGISAAIGRTLIDSFIPERAMRVIYFASEDTAEELHRRIRAITQRHWLQDETTQARLVDNLRIYPRTSFPIATKTKEGVHATPDYQRVEMEAREFGANLIIFDPLAHYLNIEENSNVDMAVAMNVFQRLIEPGADRSVILVHHVSKARQDSTDSGSSRGASAFRDAIRSGWGFASLSDDEVKRFNIEANKVWRYVKIENTKCNWGPRHSRPIFLKREDHGVLTEVNFQKEYAEMIVQKRVAEYQDDDEVPF